MLGTTKIRKLFSRFSSLVFAGVILLPLMILPARQVIFIGQMEILSKIVSDSLQLTDLVFNKEEYHQLHFERNGRELFYNGSMFDIFSIDSTGSNYLIKALRDDKETRLFAGCKDLHENRAVNRAPVTGMPFMPYFPMIPFGLNLNCFQSGDPVGSEIAGNYLDPLLPVGAHPPKKADCQHFS
jgi:hypothetical protein